MDVRIREAMAADVAAIRELLADDELGRQREDLSAEGLERYQAAFEKISEDPRNQLFVAVEGTRLVGTFQLTWIPYLSRGGNERAHIEAVRVARSHRNLGIGGQMMKFALERARERGCLIAQLTTDRSREAAHRFYRKLGFEASHHGMKLLLQEGR